MTDYFLNRRTGSDGGSGTFQNPWLTVAKVNGFSFGANDRIFFYGESVAPNVTDVWREMLTVPRSGILFGTYGPGSTAGAGCARITGGDIVTGWTVYAGTTFQVAVVTQPNQIWADNVALVKSAGTRDTLANGEWVWTTGVLYYRRDAGNPDTASVVVEVGARTQALFGTGKTDITLQDLLFTCGNDVSFGVVSAQGGPTNWLAQNVTITKAAQRGMDVFGDNFRWIGGEISNVNGIGLQLGGSTSVGALVDGLHGHDNGSNAIGVTSGGVIIRRSKLHDDGWNTALPAHAVYITANVNGIGGHNAILEDNEMYNYPTNGDSAVRASGNGHIVRRNKIDNSWTGIGSGDFDVANMCSGHNYERNVISNYTKVAISGAGLKDSVLNHNTFSGTGGAAWGVYLAVGTPQVSSGVSTRDNIFAGNLLHWIVDPGQTTGFVSDKNLYDSDVGTRFGWSGNANTNFAGWKSQSGQDANSPVPADPLFVNVGAKDFRIQRGSPAVNKAVVIPGVNDTPRYKWKAPDIGYWESPYIRVPYP